MNSNESLTRDLSYLSMLMPEMTKDDRASFDENFANGSRYTPSDISGEIKTVHKVLEQTPLNTQF